MISIFTNVLLEEQGPVPVTMIENAKICTLNDSYKCINNVERSEEIFPKDFMNITSAM